MCCVCVLLPCFSRSPVRVVPDPIRGAPHVLVMCEVFAPDGSAHPTNTRAKLRELMSDKVKASDPWFGFEQVCVRVMSAWCWSFHNPLGRAHSASCITRPIVGRSTPC